MKRILGLLILSLCVHVHAGDKLHVAAGKQYSVAADTQELVLKELILEDGAALLIPSSISRFQITADKASIGKQVKIMAAGGPGVSGNNGKDRSGQGPECEPALAGEAGQSGADGGSGTRITLSLAIARLGSLSIDTHGGQGGDGGNGGKGQDAGPFERCNAPDGGDGGAGGNAGNGGAGGSVAVYYSLLPNAELAGSVSDLIQVSASGGAAGEPGQGGQGGAGTEGQYVTMRTLAGSKKWIAGGKTGKAGASGNAGAGGADGQSEIVRTGIAASAPQNSSKQEQSVQTIDELTKRLEAQERQLQQMSTKMNQVVKQLEGRIELLEKKVK